MVDSKGKHFIKSVLVETPIVKMTVLFIVLWMLFSAAVYWGEQDMVDTTITSYGKALYWGVAAFSTAGIADMPLSGRGEIFGAIWIVLGSMMFFGAIIASITAYFMRPLQRPLRQIIDTIEFHLEQLDNLSIQELELLKATVDTLIEHMEKVRSRKLKLHEREKEKLNSQKFSDT